MSGFETWWRKLGGLVTVCLLATLLAGPTFDAFLCKEDAVAVGASSHEAVLSQGDHQDDGHSGGGAAACPHGHCHHGASFGVTMIESGAALTAAAEAHRVSPPSRHASLAPSGLERPPRV